ncbi:MAG: twitching motility protein PilT [Acidobacteria bacterium]|nr:MAG: twitching motility protein PilT [Acidobacteriota bacterium]
MTAPQFVDTNILLYAISNAADEAQKSREARRLLEGDDLALSVQVLQEFFVQATRKSRPDALTTTQASQLVEAFLRFPVQENTVSLMTAAFASSARFRISYWDAAVLEAARSLGCKTVLSEDLAHGRDYDGVVVRNPFRRK